MSVGNTRYQGPGDFNLFALEILTKDASFDIREVFVELNIYEDLFAPTISGDVTIADARNLPYYGPILGGEILNIGINTPTLQTENEGIQTEMLVYGMPHRELIKDRLQTLVVSAASPVAFQNMRTRVSQAYEGTHSDIIKEIFETYLNVDDVEDLELETDKFKEKVIVPNWRPLETIQWLTNRSVSESDGADYLFYQTRDGFQFKSLSTLLSNDPSATISIEKGGLQEIDVQTINRVSASAFDETFNRLNELKEGMNGSTLLTLDQTRKQIEKTTFDYVSEWNNRSHAEANKTMFDDEPVSPLSKIVVRNKRQHLYGDGEEGEEHDDNAKEHILRRRSFIQEQQRYRYLATVTGNANIKLGDMITLNIPSPEMVNPSSDEQLDGHLSGKWLVTSIRHKITRSEHMMTLDLLKDSFKDALLVGSRPLSGTSGGTFF